MVDQLRAKGLDLTAFCPIRVRDGKNTRFRLDVWSGENPLASTFHRIYALDLCKNVTVNDRLDVDVFTSSLRRFPKGGM